MGDPHYYHQHSLIWKEKLATPMVLYSAGRTTSYPTEPVEEGIRIHFLGGGDEVGNVGCVLEDRTGTRIPDRLRTSTYKTTKVSFRKPPVDHAIITHSHIDHIGMAPWLVGHHGTTLHGTELTAAFSGNDVARHLQSIQYRGLSTSMGYERSRCSIGCLANP